MPGQNKIHRAGYLIRRIIESVEIFARSHVIPNFVGALNFRNHMDLPP